MPNMYNDLIKVADLLDEKGLLKEANFVDLLVKSATERTRAVENYIESLKKHFQQAAASSKVFPTIKKSLPEILRIIDLVAGFRDYLNPSSTEETLKTLNPNEIQLLVESISARQDDIEDIKKEMTSMSKMEYSSENIDKFFKLQEEYKSLARELKAKYDEVAKLRATDVAKFREFMKLYDAFRVNRKIKNK